MIAFLYENSTPSLMSFAPNKSLRKLIIFCNNKLAIDEYFTGFIVNRIFIVNIEESLLKVNISTRNTNRL